MRMLTRNKKAGRAESYLSKDERIRQIVKTSASLFIKKGYYETTTRQIAEACGITSGTLYHYIRAKDDLLAMFSDLLALQFGKFEKKVRRELPRITAQTALKNTVRGFLTMIDDIQDMVLFWYEESKNLDAEHLKTMMDIDLKVMRLFVNVIEKGCDGGHFKVADPVVAAYGIKMICDTWVLKRWYLHNLYSVEEYISKCEDIALAIVHGENKAATAGNRRPLKAV